MLNNSECEENWQLGWNGIERWFDCPACDKIFSQRGTLNRHYRSAHMRSRYYCEICGEDFVEKAPLRSHIQSAHFEIRISKSADDNRESFDCALCEKKFTGRGILNRHYQSAHLGVRYYCELCGKDFVDKPVLKKHILSVHLGIKIRKDLNRAKKWFDCSECGKRFAYNHTMKRHVQLAHSGIRYHCEFCDKIFTQKAYLKYHARSVHGSKTKSEFDCSKCGKKCLNTRGLERHNLSAHSDSRFVCHLCGEIYVEKANLKSHILYVHLGIRFDCKLCGQSFPRNFQLKRHEGLHSVTQFTRDIRSDKFSFIEKRNERTEFARRLSEKPHKCPTCAEIFFKKEELKAHAKSSHIKIHFVCDSCGEIFIEKTELRLHNDSARCGKKAKPAINEFSKANNIRPRFFESHSYDDAINIDRFDLETTLKNESERNNAEEHSARENYENECEFVNSNETDESESLILREASITAKSVPSSPIDGLDLDERDKVDDGNINARSTSRMVYPTSSMLCPEPSSVVETFYRVDDSNKYSI